MKKIILIGQAPPLQKQEYPYDSTLLYEWLGEIGISKIEAQDLFDFEAMTDKIPEVTKSGHKPPSNEEMEDYYNRVLKDKIKSSDKVILLGASPRNFFKKKEFFKRYDKNGIKVLSLIHPSKRNYKMYNDNKELILKLLKEIIYDNTI